MKAPLFMALLLGAGIVPATYSSVTVYVVPAISSDRHRPDKVSSDAPLSTSVQIVATPGEFEPASFLVATDNKIDKFEIASSALKGPDGAVISADSLNLRIVKSWYQAGTAWHSYFGDPTRRELVPELLLHDDTLVKVDREKQENYLRVGNDYQWVSYPSEKAEKYFNYLTEPVADARKLQPVAIPQGENRQFWLTLKVPDDAKPGVYHGTLAFTADGRAAGNLEVQLRVLPFRLPVPATYYNLDNEYLVTIYGTDMMDLARRFKIDAKQAQEQQMKIYRNLVDHNVRNIRSSLVLNNRNDRDQAREDIRTELRLIKESGASMKPLMTNGWVFFSPGDDKREDRMERFKTRIDDYIKTVKEEVGHEDLYFTSWDEAGAARVKIFRELAEHTEKQGIKIWMTTAHDRHFNLAGYAIDLANHGGWPDRNEAAHWHAIGAKVGSYAGPHTGIENPDIFRRWEGLARYKENYDASFNYKYTDPLHPTLYEKQKHNVWNDFLRSEFRNFCMVYPTSDGVIDTLAWEGFREGIDDVRYATLLKQEAKKAMESGNSEARSQGRKALMWLELLDAKTADLNSVRQEMIEYIVKIQNANLSK